MGKKFLHINYNPMVGWAYPVVNRLNEGGSGLKEKIKVWDSSGLSDLAIAVSTKLKVLSLAIVRANEKLHTVSEQLEDTELLKKCYDEGKAYTFKDQDLTFELVIDLETFIFESRSTYEIVGKFVTEFFNIILEKRISERDLIDNLKKKGINTDWIEILRGSRIFFFHNGAPWIGLRPLDESFSSFEPIMLKKNILELENEDDYLPFTKLKDIYIHFSGALTSLQQYIIEEIDDFDK